jgi:Flp pilus assembly pilin Flp
MKSSFEYIRKRHFLALLGSEKGATSVEYAILGALIAAVIALVVFNLGSQVRLLFEAATKGW